MHWKTFSTPSFFILANTLHLITVNNYRGAKSNIFSAKTCEGQWNDVDLPQHLQQFKFCMLYTYMQSSVLYNWDQKKENSGTPVPCPIPSMFDICSYTFMSCFQATTWLGSDVGCFCWLDFPLNVKMSWARKSASLVPFIMIVRYEQRSAKDFAIVVGSSWRTYILQFSYHIWHSGWSL